MDESLPPILIPALWQLFKYCTKELSEVTSKSLARRIAKNESIAEIIRAQSDSEVQRIRVTSQVRDAITLASGIAQVSKISSELSHGNGSEMSTIDPIQAQIRHKAARQIDNIQSIIEKAAVDLGAEFVEDHDPDEEWSAQFFGNAQDVSSEDLQRLWARVLAQEIRHRGSTSIRTLSVLKNLNRDEAEQFAAIRQFVFDDKFILRYEHRQLADVFPELHPEILTMIQDAGLLLPDWTLVSEWNNESSGQGHFSHRSSYQTGTLLLRHATALEHASIPAIPLSNAGRELVKIVAPAQPNSSYLRHLAAHLNPPFVKLYFLSQTDPHDKREPEESELIKPQL